MFGVSTACIFEDAWRTDADASAWGTPNSEVVTNVALNVDHARLENLTFSLELNASASNSLSIAVGTADGDSLALEDVDFEWGYVCGKWFHADTETGNVAEWPEPGTGRVSRTLTIDRNGFKSQWNRLRIVKRGVGDIRLTRPIPERTLSFSSA